MATQKWDIIVVGGGSSGLMCAISAVKAGKRVLILEKMPQLGLKLRISGQGRANIGNTAELKRFLEHCGTDFRFLYPSFHTFFTQELIALLSELGVQTKEERGGRLFPQSEKAQDVFLALVRYLEASEHCTIMKNQRVQSVICEGERAVGVRTEKEEFYGTSIVLATGGLSYPRTGSTGDGLLICEDLSFDIETPVPALVGFKCRFPNSEWRFDESFVAKNANVMVIDANQKKIAEAFGEIEFTSFGVAGATILTLSRQIARRVAAKEPLRLVIDLKPSVEAKKLDVELIEAISKVSSKYNKITFKSVSSAVRSALPQPLVDLCLAYAEIDSRKSCAQITSEARKAILRSIKSLTLTIETTEGWERAVITRGGVSLSEVNPKTLESKKKKGLYLCGELLDLDADTGGYNLQIAFSTGWLAGQNA
ncbi:MAG: NAD(P)/FAD-dependent oxidoreductase [Bacteroidales bacterium]|jgi:predicted Rossmann fold flavoprotein|nr:NAD(P)/FAD-dependent oxidoreductase [Bacteroidales bacterium]